MGFTLTKMPRPAPMLASDAKTLPSGDGWAYEIKWDGVRALAALGPDRTQIWSRRGEEIAARYPELAPMGPAIAPRSAILDGEIVALDESGRPSFQLLQRRMGVTAALTVTRRAAETPVHFVAFDLLELDGEDIRGEPYERRRELLAGLEFNGPNWQTPRHHLGDGEALLEAAKRQGLEGVVAKRLGSAYREGARSRDWIKVRIKQRQDFVIGGWYGGDGNRSGRLGSLLLGVWDVTPEAAVERGEPQLLLFAGGVGSGLTDRTIDELGELLAPLARETSPFQPSIGGPKRADPHFVEPRLVCSVEFSEWTREATLRQPAFKGLREDVEVESVVREG
jgi:bifunctional non-homologous end joining protein LigD